MAEAPVQRTEVIDNMETLPWEPGVGVTPSPRALRCPSTTPTPASLPREDSCRTLLLGEFNEASPTGLDAHDAAPAKDLSIDRNKQADFDKASKLDSQHLKATLQAALATLGGEFGSDGLQAALKAALCELDGDKAMADEDAQPPPNTNVTAQEVAPVDSADTPTNVEPMDDVYLDPLDTSVLNSDGDAAHADPLPEVTLVDMEPADAVYIDGESKNVDSKDVDLTVDGDLQAVTPADAEAEQGDKGKPDVHLVPDSPRQPCLIEAVLQADEGWPVVQRVEQYNMKKASGDGRKRKRGSATKRKRAAAEQAPAKRVRRGVSRSRLLLQEQNTLQTPPANTKGHAPKAPAKAKSAGKPAKAKAAGKPKDAKGRQTKPSKTGTSAKPDKHEASNDPTQQTAAPTDVARPLKADASQAPAVLSNSKSFARRPCPKPTASKERWLAIRSCFEEKVRPKLAATRCRAIQKHED